MIRILTLVLATLTTTATAGAICRDDCSPCGFRPVTQPDPCECDEGAAGAAGGAGGGGLPIGMAGFAAIAQSDLSRPQTNFPTSGNWSAFIPAPPITTATRDYTALHDTTRGGPDAPPIVVVPDLPIDLPPVDSGSPVPEPSSIVAMAGFFLCSLWILKR